MKNPPRRFNLFIFLLIFGALMLLLSALMREPDLPSVNYSQVHNLITEEKVHSFQWKDGLLTLELKEPNENGDSTVGHELASMDIFWEDLGAEINRQLEEGTIESYEILPVTPTPWYIELLPYVLISIVLFVVMYFMLARAGGGGGSAAKFGRANARIGSGEKKVTFADVAGAEEEKAELVEIVDYLRDPQKYRRIGARIPRGVLLVGPPGTGKTLLAKAVAGEADVQFLSISGSDFVELYVGVGASRVRDLFEQAKRGAPSIIFIDEIDAVGRQRGAGLGGGHDEREQTLNQLLVEMDGFGSNQDVIVMAATNRQDILDPALLRPGRFDRQIYVNAPDCKGREDILHVHARNKLLADDVDLHTIALATGGFTGADLANLLNEAALTAARKNCPVITMQSLEDAILKVIAGPEKRSKERRERDLRITAYHEAGHAIAMHFLPTQDPVHQVTIVARGHALGMTISLPEQEADHRTRKQMQEEIVGLLGGRVAEDIIFDDISTGASSDLKRATGLARDMIAKYGMGESIGAVSYDSGSEIFVGRDYERTKSYSEQTAAAIDSEMKKVIDAAYARCKQILTENIEKLHEIAAYLLAHETMSRRQFEACMAGEEIPETAESFFEAAANRAKEETPAPTEEQAETSDESPE